MNALNQKILKTAVITGAGSGLGRALSMRLARDNWHIALADINTNSARETLGLIQSMGHGSGEVFELDVTKIESWTKLKADLKKKTSKIDLLVNNAGITASGEVGVFPMETWHKVIDINLWGVINGCHTFVDWLKENPGSHILNISSIFAFTSGPTIAAYNVSKAGVLSLSETLYTELLRHKVGVSAACPGFFPSNLIANGKYCSKREEEYAKNETKKSSITPDSVADYLIRGVFENRLYLMTPFLESRAFWFAKRLAPRIFMKLAAFIGYRRLERLDAAARA